VGVAEALAETLTEVAAGALLLEELPDELQAARASPAHVMPRTAANRRCGVRKESIP
jgi:hypothetical protein